VHEKLRNEGLDRVLVAPESGKLSFRIHQYRGFVEGNLIYPE
jgi:hypothetical protein